MINQLTVEEALELTKCATKDVAHSVWCTYYKNFTPEELVDKLVVYKGAKYWVSVWKYTNKAELRTTGKCYLGFVQTKVFPSPINEHWEEYKNPQKFEWDLELFQEG
jgi:hypothetical protein